MSSWPPNYTEVFAERQRRFLAISKDAKLMIGAREHYRSRPIEFIEDWCITYDPRNAGTDVPTYLPFVLFDKQREMIEFLLSCIEDNESGLIEKSRDMGATWVCCALSVWMWLYQPGSSVGWGSRKEQLVDKIGDPDSIFEKMRKILDNLPTFLLPLGFDPKKHSSYMKIINPDNESTITGESGDNIGRGGRKKIYFKDEAAHYERPELIEAALNDNTDVQIDLSSVNGTANVFARRRQTGEEWAPGRKIPSGIVRVFVLDWSDHPLKTREWHDRRRDKAQREGLSHIFAQEVERNYAAAVEGVIIPAEWVRSATDLHTKLNVRDVGDKIAALDVADEGGDANALAARKGITLFALDKWAKGDTGQTAQKAVAFCRENGISELDYDCIGVGAGVKAETNRLRREGLLPKGVKIVKWNAADSPLDAEQHVVPNDRETPLNKDMFKNLKAQSAWRLRIRFEKTHNAVTRGVKYDHSELINLRSDVPYFHELELQLSQPTYSRDGSGRIVVNKKPNGTKSPNLYDSVAMAYNPCRQKISLRAWREASA